MARKQETREADPIRDYLDSLPECFYFKVHGNQYQKAGLPDFIGCYRGRFFGFEQKTATGVVRAGQRNRLRQIRDAGGIAAIVRSVADVRYALGMPLQEGETINQGLFDIDYVPIHKRGAA